MGALKTVIRSVASGVARRVAEHDLFERRGERPPSSPLPSVESPEGSGEPLSPSLEPKAEAAASGVVTSVNLSALASALGPGTLRVVNHWATWCDGCVEELPELVRLQQALGKDVQFLGVSWDRFQPFDGMEATKSAIQSVMTQAGADWSTLVLDDSVVPELLFERWNMPVHTIPQTWVVDASGSIVERIEHVMTAAMVDDLTAKIRELL